MPEACVEEVVIIDNIMKLSKNNDILAETPDEQELDEHYMDFPERETKEPDVVLYGKQKGNHGVTIFSAERWYMRILIFITNPFRYLFTGRTRF